MALRDINEEANTTLTGKKSNKGDLRNCGMLNVMSILGEMMEKILREPTHKGQGGDLE